MESEDFFKTDGGSEAYAVIETTMMEGREIFPKKYFAYLFFTRIENEVGIKPADIEISIVQSPSHDWGFRGMTGDEALLSNR